MVKDVLIQMLRNAAVHGIESPTSVARTPKEEGHRARGLPPGRHGYELVCEDDGAGLIPEQLKAAAVRKQIVTAEEAAAWTIAPSWR